MEQLTLETISRYVKDKKLSKSSHTGKVMLNQPDSLLQ